VRSRDRISADNGTVIYGKTRNNRQRRPHGGPDNDFLPPVAIAVFSGITVLLGVLYQVCLSPMLELSGTFRNVEPMNTERCEVVEGEFTVPTGTKYYLARKWVFLLPDDSARH
jgi:hypothetical protein